MGFWSVFQSVINILLWYSVSFAIINRFYHICILKNSWYNKIDEIYTDEL